MPIIENARRTIFELPGLKHQTLASRHDGLKQLEVWIQTIHPGACTPVHYHECEEVIVIERGSGSLMVAEQRTDFAAGSTLVIEPRAIHQLTNTGQDEMLLMAVLSETPGRVLAPDGSEMVLPWS